MIRVMMGLVRGGMLLQREYSKPKLARLLAESDGNN